MLKAWPRAFTAVLALSPSLARVSAAIAYYFFCDAKSFMFSAHIDCTLCCQLAIGKRERELEAEAAEEEPKKKALPHPHICSCHPAYEGLNADLPGEEVEEEESRGFR